MCKKNCFISIEQLAGLHGSRPVASIAEPFESSSSTKLRSGPHGEQVSLRLESAVEFLAENHLFASNQGFVYRAGRVRTNSNCFISKNNFLLDEFRETFFSEWTILNIRLECLFCLEGALEASKRISATLAVAFFLANTHLQVPSREFQFTIFCA